MFVWRRRLMMRRMKVICRGGWLVGRVLRVWIVRVLWRLLIVVLFVRWLMLMLLVRILRPWLVGRLSVMRYCMSWNLGLIRVGRVWC